MKTGILIYSMASGGAERVISYLLPHLIAKKHEVILILMNDTVTYEIPEKVKVHFLEKSKGHEAGLLKLLKLPILARRYAQLLKKEKINCSFSLLTRPNYINILARWFTNHEFKLIISERNFPSEQYGKDNLQSKINTTLVKWLYPKGDLVITNAKASANDLIKNFNVPIEKTMTIYNPIAINKIQKIEKKEGFFDTSFVNAITVGRLMHQKNHKFLLDAIEPFKNLRLYIIGEGHLRKDLEQKISNLGLQNRVFLMGHQENPFQYLKGANFFLFGSLHEGFPNVLMEAMCCGLPIVSTNCKSGPDEMMELKEVKKNSFMLTDYGILTPTNDLKSMRDAIQYIINNEEHCHEWSRNAARRILDFKKEPILEAYRKAIIQ